MPGFEVVVRPVVFPNIRPSPARSLPPEDDSEKGFAVIHGNGGKQVTLSNSWSSSASSNSHRESKRQVDKARVYQKNDDNTVNKSNFVDVEVPTKIWMDGPPGTIEVHKYAPVQEQSNIEIKERDKMQTRQ